MGRYSFHSVFLVWWIWWQ